MYFVEQLQVFLLTFDHFTEYLAKPAFLASYIGDFLTQFYWLGWGGAVVITATLTVLWKSTEFLLKRLIKGYIPFILSLVPVAFSWIALCNPEYPLSNVISLIISAFFAAFYVSLRSSKARTVCGIVFPGLVYVLAGSSVAIFAVVAIIYEAFYTDSNKDISGKVTNLVILAVSTIAVPLVTKDVFTLSAGQAFTYLSSMTLNADYRQFLPLFAAVISVLIACLPWNKIIGKTHSLFLHLIQFIILAAILIPGIFLFADFELEKILRLDHEASNQRWAKVYSLSRKYDMRNNLSSYYANISLAKLGKMPDELMEHYQPAATGLFIPVDANENYLTITFSNEVYWELGDVNASQHSALLGTVFSPRAQNSRLMKRIAEINIVNGEYAVAEKYLKILEKTMFHRRWASERIRYLYNEDECSKAEWITEKRAFIPLRDMLTDRNEYVNTLRMLADNHPDNRMAIDYLLCYHLLSKDLNTFVTDFDNYYKPEMDPLLPKVYQEGLLIKIVTGEKKPDDFKDFRFNPLIIKRMAEYTDLYDKNKGNGKMLYKDYGTTYWYYYHFAVMKSE